MPIIVSIIFDIFALSLTGISHSVFVGVQLIATVAATFLIVCLVDTVITCIPQAISISVQLVNIPF